MTIQDELEPKPKEYQYKINVLVEQFSSVLDDFKKYYVFTNKNPEVNEYQKFFLENKSQLDKLNKDVFLIRNDIETNITQLNHDMIRLNTNLSSEKELKDELTKLVDNLKDDESGSTVMLLDSNNIYNQKYLINVEIAFGIIIVGYLLFRVFKNKK
jgi:predicted RNase H-like nuclease (RuvC/YqgF family)